jgi:UDP-2,3-diacylglucosamine pyrophosphatase LpxH
MHNPWYNSNLAHQDETETVDMRNAMEDLLYLSNVNLVISGHIHAYERAHPVYQNLTIPNGITYVRFWISEHIHDPTILSSFFNELYFR